MNATLDIASPDDDLRPLLRRGFAVLLLGLGGFLGFAAFAPVDQAMPGSGVIGLAGQRKAVQHPAGGRVLRLAVQEGDTVRQGQVLLSLDVREQRAELASLQRQKLLWAATSERLSALLDGQPALSFSAALRADAASPEGASLLATQRHLFASQRAGHAQAREQLSSRAAQVRAAQGGQGAALDQQREQRRLLEEQTAQFEDLARQGFYPKLKLGEAQRQLVAARQEEARLQGELQRSGEALSEAGTALALRGSEQRRDWEAELLEAERQAAVLGARAQALALQVAQADITAPVSGTVVGLVAHTVGGVVQPAQTLMELVPQDDALVVDARFALNGAEKLHAGQAADLHFGSLDRARTPVLQGQVLTVSADRLEDAHSGQPYLRVRVAVPAAEQARLRASGATLRAGLPVEVMVRLGERSLLGYLVKPLSERVARAFTE